jgi:hypothetical protein
MGAAVTAKNDAGQEVRVGTASPERLIIWRQSRDHSGSYTCSLSLPLHNQQLLALERFRGKGDIAFELSFFGRGDSLVHGSDTSTEHVFGQAKFICTQSNWIKQLQRVRASNVELFEVFIPVAQDRTKFGRGAKHLSQARLCFDGGDYDACVGECRRVFEAIDRAENFFNPLKDLAGRTEREAMDQDDRLRAVLGATRFATHLAHHAPGPEDLEHFSRDDAETILMMTALALNHYSKSGW